MPLEVGARGFFFRSLFCCLWILGFNILVKKFENCERIINGILFLYLAGKRKLVWQSAELNSPLPILLLQNQVVH